MADSVFMKEFDQLDADDIKRLVKDEVAEGRVLDYKVEQPGNSDGDRKEFLADISSFANSSGGYLVFGVEEKRENGKATGIPATAKGLAEVNAGIEIAKLENVIRDGIAPRIAGIGVREIPGLLEGPAIIFRIPRSWVGPHMVDYKGHSRFRASSTSRIVRVPKYNWSCFISGVGLPLPRGITLQVRSVTPARALPRTGNPVRG
jgi:predicted HTH transcriptional regulator